MYIFLSGGGGAEDSHLLDERFAEILDSNKPLIHIPTLREPPYEKSLVWILEVFSKLGITDIKLATDLRELVSNDPDSLGLYEGEAYSGIHIGGGTRSVQFLREIKDSGFDRYLQNLASRGIPIYGGSAGAIILGQRTETNPRVEDAIKSSDDEDLRKGIDLVPFSLYCHFGRPDKEDENKQKAIQRQSERLMRLQRERGVDPIVAIPEGSGILYDGSSIEVIGNYPVTVFTDVEISNVLSPGETINIENL